MHDIARDVTPINRSDLVYRFAPQLFRLALITTGNMNAALQRLEQSYRSLPEDSVDPESDLIRGLLPRRSRRFSWRMTAEADEVARAGVTPEQAGGLLRVLGRYTPAQRLVVGLHVLRGTAAEDIAAILRDSAPDPAGVLQQFRLDAAVALGALPLDADKPLLLELDQWLDGRLNEEASIYVRRMLLEDEDARALRNALQHTRHIIGQAVPALFAARLSNEALENILDVVEPQPAPTAGGKRLLWPSLVLGAVVLAIVAAIIFRPSMFGQNGTTAQRALSAAEIVEASIRRFDQPALQAGVLYERYRVQRDNQQPAVFERRYDYASPNRLMVRVLSTVNNELPLAAVSSDGNGLIQYRFQQAASDSMPSAINVRVTPDEAQSALPVLRSFFSPTSLFLNDSYAVDVSALYLGQARERDAALLGQTSYLNRPAYLLSYQAAQLPTQPATANNQPVRVLLTIDRATYALLDVTVIPAGVAESTATHPWRAEAFDVSASAPDSAFQLPSTGQVAERQGLVSPRAPNIPDRRILSLAQVQRMANPPLLLPDQLPSDTMFGLAVRMSPWGAERNSNTIGIFYEGEFQSLVLLPREQYDHYRDTAELGPEYQAGDYRYRFVNNDGGRLGAVTAEVYRAGGQGEQMSVIFMDAYATQAEREAQLTSVIKSLTPVTAQNLPELESRFPQASNERG